MYGPNMSIIHRLHCTVLVNIINISTELTRIALSNRSTQQHMYSFKYNSQQKYHAQLYVDAMYHMNDM